MQYVLPDKPFVSRAEAADIFGVTPKTLRLWEREGRGPPVIRVSTNVAHYPVDGLRAFIEAAWHGGRAPA